ncbi:MAG: hypothetical protein HZB42_04395 [Sphingobacteriales bacterium]|nr:hypothetical protein [Sphingobacteriales bacterium]
MSPKEKFTEKKFVIEKNQTVAIYELDISITNAGCMRQWVSEEGKLTHEKPFCPLTVKMKDSTYHFGDSFSPLYIKNLKLVVDKMNPWEGTEDSIPPGGCRVIVTRLEDSSR